MHIQTGIEDKSQEIAQYDWHGHLPWGNYGDGLWRVKSKYSDNYDDIIEPSPTVGEAHRRLMVWLNQSPIC
jgi:hypothetical protein